MYDKERGVAIPAGVFNGAASRVELSGVQSTTSPRAEVPSLLSAQEEIISSLLDETDTLAQVLEPVMVSLPPAPTRESNDVGGATKLGGVIAGNTARLAIVLWRLRSMRERVAV